MGSIALVLANHNLDWKLETTAKGCVMHNSYIIL